MNTIPEALRAEAAEQPDPAHALARLERTVAGVQASQRQALQTLIQLVKERPDEAEALAEEIVSAWTRATMEALSAVALGLGETGGTA